MRLASSSQRGSGSKGEKIMNQTAPWSGALHLRGDALDIATLVAQSSPTDGASHHAIASVWVSTGIHSVSQLKPDKFISSTVNGAPLQTGLQVHHSNSGHRYSVPRTVHSNIDQRAHFASA